MSAQVAADLRAAADVLEHRGWTQGLYCRRHWFRRRYCPSGALLEVIQPKAQDGTSLAPPEGSRWWGAIWAVERQVGRALEIWNDAPGRTADEVIAALRTAADRAEADQ